MIYDVVHVSDEQAAEDARRLIDSLEAELLGLGASLEMLEQLGHAHRVQAQIEAKMGAERRIAEQRRAYGEARDRHEVGEALWSSFQEAQRHLRRSKMSAESKSRAINRYGLTNYFRIPW